MKCQFLFSGKTMKNITNLLAAELAQRVVKVKRCRRNSAHDCTVLHSTEPFIVSLLSQYYINIVERDLKH